MSKRDEITYKAKGKPKQKMVSAVNQKLSWEQWRWEGETDEWRRNLRILGI